MQQAPEPPIKDPAQRDASKADALRVYSMEEVEQHDSRESAWFVHRGQVRFRLCPSTFVPLLVLPCLATPALPWHCRCFQL